MQRLKCLSESTFYSYQHQFICPTIKEYYIKEQMCIITIRVIYVQTKIDKPTHKVQGEGVDSLWRW